MYHLLIVEDDKDLATITQIYFNHYGYTSDIAYTCIEAKNLLLSASYDCVILDVLLPDGTSITLRNTIQQTSHCPILFLSCLDYSISMELPLSNSYGYYEEYIVKPIPYDALLQRVSQSIKWYQEYPYHLPLGAKDMELRIFKSFAVDTTHKRILKNREEIDLPATEYALLMTLIAHPNTLLLYDTLYQTVWAQNSLQDTRTLMVHISNLRKKLDPQKLGIIETVRGAGYIFSDI